MMTPALQQLELLCGSFPVLMHAHPGCLNLPQRYHKQHTLC